LTTGHGYIWLFTNECIVFCIVFVSHTRLDLSLVFVEKFKFILKKMHKNCCHQVTRTAPFGSNMYQIVCWLGLRPKPHWGSLQRSPRTPSLFRGWGPPGAGEREGGRGGEKERGEGRVTEGRESRNAQIQSWQACVQKVASGKSKKIKYSISVHLLYGYCMVTVTARSYLGYWTPKLDITAS